MTAIQPGLADPIARWRIETAAPIDSSRTSPRPRAPQSPYEACAGSVSRRFRCHRNMGGWWFPGGWQLCQDDLIAMFDTVLDTYRTDPDRVYLTGLSYGGNGTWHTECPSWTAGRRLIIPQPLVAETLTAAIRAGYPTSIGTVINEENPNPVGRTAPIRRDRLNFLRYVLSLSFSG